MRVIVTGGAGGVGASVVEELSPTHEVVVADVRKPSKEVSAFRQVDLVDLQATRAAIRDADAVVHLAAIPHPHNDPPDRVVHVNMVSTYNVLEAMRANGISRGVYAGSDSGTGFGIHNVAYRPLYLPIDVEHPCWPHESYSFTKYFGEEMFREYARAYGMRMSSVRFMWVWLERDRAAVTSLLERRKTMEIEGISSYVMPQDVAQMVRLVLGREPAERDGLAFEVFFAHAARTFSNLPTLELARRMWQPMPEIRRPEHFRADELAPMYDQTREYHELGYRPQYSYTDYPI
jgi:nucleoside-diphosphate-sugar epimerase